MDVVLGLSGPLGLNGEKAADKAMAIPHHL